MFEPMSKAMLVVCTFILFVNACKRTFIFINVFIVIFRSSRLIPMDVRYTLSIHYPEEGRQKERYPHSAADNPGLWQVTRRILQGRH